MKCDVNLIIPPSPFLGDQKRQPPLGILYVAATMEEQGLSVTMTDLRGVEKDKWMDQIPECPSYGITATTPEYPYALDIAKTIKSRYYAKITLGGIHATAIPQSVNPTFDYVYVGEYEYVADMDEIPFPARHLLPRESFVSDKLCELGEDATTMMVSRGCAHNCSYCSTNKMWGRKVRYRSVGNAIDEVRCLKGEYGVRQIRFHDDTMTINRPWVMNFSREMSHTSIKWRAATRVDRSDYDLLSAMYDGGCYELAYGIEDPNQAVLDKNCKGVKEKDIYSALKNAKKVGMKTRLYLMIGLPGQDGDTSRRMIRFIEEVNPDVVDISTFVPFPGSEVYQYPSKFGIKLKRTPWEDYVFTRGLYGDEADKDFVYEHDVLSNDSLKEQRKEVLEYIKKRHLTLNA